ncbi:MAG: M24 family metallopeptidase [Candidatus Caldarchaeum sp.]
MSEHPYEDRLERFLSRLRSSPVEAVILSKQSNVQYFTGSQNGMLLITVDGTVSIFSNTPVNTPLASRIHIVERLGRREIYPTVFEYIGDRRMAVGYDSMPAETYQSIIKNYPSLSLTCVKDLVYEQRQSKSEREIELIRKASSIASFAMDIVREVIAGGTTASDIRRALADNIYRLEADLPYSPHISIGEDTFLNIDSPANRGIREGELVKITLSASVEGYISQISRTYFYKKSQEKIKKTYQQLIRLKEHISSLLSVWSSAVSIYDRARAFAMEIGLDPTSLTLFGRGVGLEAEEHPFIDSASTDIIREGAVVCVGPDLLLPGRYGLSVSDIYLVTSRGVEKLTDADTEMEVG